MNTQNLALKIKALVFVASLFAMSAYAQDAKMPCLKSDGRIGLKGLDQYDCGLTRAVVNDQRIKDSHQAKIWGKLADKLSLKATQRLEEMALLDQYFSQNKKDLMMNSSAVEKSCRLETISTPKCGPSTNPENYKKKLALLLGHFPEPKDSKDSNLYNRMRTKFSEMRGVQVNSNQCPIAGTSGFFFLSSQLTETDALNFINSLRKAEQTETSNVYESFPQLKMLKNSIKNGPAGIKMIAEFEQHLKSYDNKKGQAKDFINSFLFTDSHQEEMAKSLARQCSEITDNIKEFLCDDLDSLAMPEKFATKYFEGPDVEIDAEISKGFSCGYKKAGDGESIEDEDFLTKGKSIVSWQNKFLNDSRPVKDEFVAKRTASQFCDVYLCKAEASKQLKSCQSGGPVSSTDLLNSYCLDATAASCNNKYLSYISYLASLEKDKKEIYEPNQSLANGQSKDATEKPKGFSSFYQNFLGVEGTLLAEGKKITPITVAEKKAEFVEKKLEPTPQLAALNQQPAREIAKQQELHEDPISKDEKSDYSNSSNRDSDQFRKSFVPSFAKSSNDTPAVSQKSKKIDFYENDSRLDEMKKLRSELADAISKVQGSDEEKLAAIADNNAMAITPKNSLKDPTRNLNQGEKDRLDSYRESLNNWESRLRNWQGQLNDRDVRINSGNITAPNEVRPAASVANNSDQSGSAANNVRLTKVTAAAAVANAKADGIAGERAPGTEKSDELGVVNSENLATLQKDSLKKLGIVTSDSFIIKVRYLDKIYSIPVKTFTHEGKSMFVPLLNDKNRELAKIVYESPLFKDYRDYQIERQYKLEKK